MTTVAKKREKRTTAKQLRAMVKAFDWAAWETEVAKKMTPVYRDLVKASAASTAEQSGATFDLSDPFVQEHMTTYMGERITQLSRTTQRDVSRLLQRALRDGKDLSIADLRDRILDRVRETYDGYESWRALRIARTESAIGYNHGATLGSAQSGFDRVVVTDGTDDEACRQANGQVWTITQALNDPLAHPNCTRAFHGYDGETPAGEYVTD